MVVPEVPDRLPEILLGGGAEDFRRRPFGFGVFRPEQNAAAPNAVLGAAQGESNGDFLSVEAQGGQVVDDRFPRMGDIVSCRLCGHAEP